MAAVIPPKTVHVLPSSRVISTPTIVEEVKNETASNSLFYIAIGALVACFALVLTWALILKRQMSKMQQMKPKVASSIISEQEPPKPSKNLSFGFLSSKLRDSPTSSSSFSPLVRLIKYDFGAKRTNLRHDNPYFQGDKPKNSGFNFSRQRGYVRNFVFRKCSR